MGRDLRMKSEEVGRGWYGLPKYSKDLYQQIYFHNGEDYEGWQDRVAGAYADDEAHKERIKTYINNYWFHPSTPVSSNAGLPDKGLPISCYTNQVPDSKKGIFDAWNENNWLGAEGGGIGTNWSDVRSMGEKVGGQGESTGTIPFIKVSDSSTLAVSQGGLRRASQASYLHISHPDIEEFIDIRRPTGDSERRSLNIHHGVVIPDAFMEAVEKRSMWQLVSPKSGNTLKEVDAYDLFKKILISRIETGEPYILFEDNANRGKPIDYYRHKMDITTSNLCSEIMLYTDEDTTGVCCLVSVNLEYFDEWKYDKLFLEDIHRYTDNVLQSFIDLTEDREGFYKARNGALKERSIGIGTMGYHSYLMANSYPVESLAAYYATDMIMRHIHDELQHSNIKLAKEKGAAPLSKDKRNVNVTAIAPTASISTLTSLTSPGVDPRVSNIYVAKSNIGSYTIKNKYLERLLESIDQNTEEVWKSITKYDGSVQHLDILTDEEKEVFKTAYEINPFAIVRNISAMTPHITQGISTNLWLPADTHVSVLYKVHMDAWKKGLKSLYYLRSKAIVSANVAAQERISLEEDTCISCS